MKKIQIKTVEEHISNEIIEKKSRFIANVYPIQSKKEAENKILELKKQYKDARHNCFAFSVYEDNQKYTKCSDDGEPSGTAGVPILNVIEKNGLSNVLIIVTRYFGGILLGAGGLTRAYSGAATDAIQNCEIILVENGIELKVSLDYQDSEKFKFICDKHKIDVINIKYEEDVTYIIEISDEKFNMLFINTQSNDEINRIRIKKYVVNCRKFIKIHE